MSTIHWLSVSEVAERLGIKGDTVYTWIQTRGLPGHRLGRIWRFDPEEIDTWIRTGKSALDAAPVRSAPAKKRKNVPPKKSAKKGRTSR